MKNKHTSYILSLVLFLIMSVAALSSCSGTNFKTKTVSDNEVAILEYSGSTDRVIIPEKIKNKNVTIIKESLFKETITNLVLPKTIKSIEKNEAFIGVSRPATNIYYNGTISDWCNIDRDYVSTVPIASTTSLYVLDENGTIEYNNAKYSQPTKITIGENTTSIKYGALANLSSVTEITIGDNVNGVKSSAFSNMTNLEEVILGINTRAIESFAFEATPHLRSLKTNDSLQFIGASCFYNSSLTELILPLSLLELGNSAFNDDMHVFYKGTEDNWAGVLNSDKSKGTIYFYSSTEPAGTGNYWHYDTDNATPVIW